VIDRALLEIPTDLSRIRVRFATFREQASEGRAALARQFGSLVADERVLLDTCHRVELFTVESMPTDEAHANGRDAVQRAFEVVAGFDSAVVAEEQLLGQVRGAYESALADGSTGPILNELFRRALRFGRRVRTHARPGTDRSLADPGVAWLLERLPPASRVIVVGTGDMGRLVSIRLADAGHRITIVSASADRGGRLLEQLAGNEHHLGVGTLTAEHVARAGAIAIAIRTREPILTTALLAAGRHPLTLDLSAPSAVTADAAALLGDRLLTLDRLSEHTGATPVLAPETERRLRAELVTEVDGFVAWLDARRGADALAILHGEANAVRQRHLARLQDRTALDQGQLAAVEAASTAMLGELLHGPSLELRRGGADAATVRRLFGLDS